MNSYEDPALSAECDLVADRDEWKRLWQERDVEAARLQARLAEALKTLDAIDEEGDDHYYDIADAARMILRGIVTHGDCSEPTVNRTAEPQSAEHSNAGS